MPAIPEQTHRRQGSRVHDNIRVVVGDDRSQKAPGPIQRDSIKHS
jgi:hypothetical protein